MSPTPSKESNPVMSRQYSGTQTSKNSEENFSPCLLMNPWNAASTSIIAALYSSCEFLNNQLSLILTFCRPVNGRSMLRRPNWKLTSVPQAKKKFQFLWKKGVSPCRSSISAVSVSPPETRLGQSSWEEVRLLHISSGMVYREQTYQFSDSLDFLRCFSLNVLDPPQELVRFRWEKSFIGDVQRIFDWAEAKRPGFRS